MKPTSDFPLHPFSYVVPIADGSMTRQHSAIEWSACIMWETFMILIKSEAFHHWSCSRAARNFDSVVNFEALHRGVKPPHHAHLPRDGSYSLLHFKGKKLNVGNGAKRRACFPTDSASDRLKYPTIHTNTAFASFVTPWVVHTQCNIRLFIEEINSFYVTWHIVKSVSMSKNEIAQKLIEK